MNPSPEELRNLADKYARLAAWRREHAAGSPPPPREDFAALAAAYPGALRELDTTPLDELDARAAALRAAADGAALEPWMGWIAEFHALMRVGLAVARARPRDLEAARAIADAQGVAIAEELLLQLASPRGGRRVPLVLADIARREGVPVARVAAAIRHRLARG